MTPGTDPTETPEDDSVVIASFDSRRRAEHLLAVLGRSFRKKARAGQVTAVVVSRNSDGSLRLTQSHVVTASGFVAALIRLPLMWRIGLIGLVTSAKGMKEGVHAVQIFQRHVGSDVHPAQQILNEAGPRSAIVLVRSRDAAGQAVVEAAKANAIRYWDGSLTELLDALDPGTTDDWIRTALGQPPSTDGGA
jgi:uncharacterized membrane protein